MEHSRDRLRRVLARAIDSGRVTSSVDGSSHQIFPVAIPEREGEALRRWVERERATRTIEIGLGYGISALFMCDGLLASGSDVRHVAVDPNQISGFSSVALQLLRDAGVAEILEFHAVASEVTLPRFLSEHRAFDLAFIDGNHRFDGVFLDLLYLGRLVRAGGVIFLDDYQLPSIRKAAGFFTRNLGWSITEEGIADDRHHWVVLRTAAVPLERYYDHFVDF